MSAFVDFVKKLLDPEDPDWRKAHWLEAAHGHPSSRGPYRYICTRVLFTRKDAAGVTVSSRWVCHLHSGLN